MSNSHEPLQITLLILIISCRTGLCETHTIEISQMETDKRPFTLTTQDRLDFNVAVMTETLQTA